MNNGNLDLFEEISGNPEVWFLKLNLNQNIQNKQLLEYIIDFRIILSSIFTGD